MKNTEYDAELIFRAIIETFRKDAEIIYFHSSVLTTTFIEVCIIKINTLI